MPFDAYVFHFPTLAAFTAYLRTVPRPAWCKRLVNHNTYRPDELTWHGLVSMRAMQQVYVAKGWTSGPHLYLAAEAPNPADTGIWQLTPLAHPGTHAGACNADSIGIESVGDFDARPPSPAQFKLLIAVNRAIMEHWGIPPAQVVVHRECMVGRTCPGKHLSGPQIRAALNAPWPRARRAGPHGALARTDYTAAGRTAAYFPPGTPIDVDAFHKNEYRHAASGIGFIADGDMDVEDAL